LYNVTVNLDNDEVESYVGFRTISRGMVNGIERPLLNGEFIFMFATLDQGYWPDGLYTPPTHEAMVYDLKMLKGLGFNTVRKHVSILSKIGKACHTHLNDSRSKSRLIYFIAPAMNWACS
jgi:hypothetical protein